jgi:hypothetical protein
MFIFSKTMIEPYLSVNKEARAVCILSSPGASAAALTRDGYPKTLSLLRRAALLICTAASKADLIDWQPTSRIRFLFPSASIFSTVA